MFSLVLKFPMAGPFVAPLLLALLIGSRIAGAEGEVAQLGDASYGRRIEAAKKLLADGAGAVASLQAGLASDDPEIRRACRRLLADIYDAEHAKALAEFRARLAADGADPAAAERGYGLPGWDVYRSAIGHDAAARELFAAMQTAEPGLMASLADEEGDEGAVAIAFAGRIRQVMGPLMRARIDARQTASLGTIATLLFIGGDERFDLRNDAMTSAAWPNLVRQEAFEKALAADPMKPYARKLLGRWIARPSDESQLQQKLLLAFQYELPEGLALGVKAAGNTDLHGYYRVYAVHAIGRIGGAAHAARLAPLLDDQAACGQRMRAGRGNDDPQPIQIRDVALAWLIQLTGQKHADYELPEAAETFATMTDSAYVNLQNIGFDSAVKREAAMTKWKAYVAANPLPSPPAIEEPAKSDAAAADGGEPKAGFFQQLGRAIGAQGRAQIKANPKRRLAARRAAEAADEDEAEAIGAGGLPIARRELVQLLSAAEAAIAEGDYAEAARALALVLGEPEDAVYSPGRQSPVTKSVKAAAEALLAAMPAAGWKSYELQTGPEAASLLKDAAESGDDAKLAKVARVYYFTRAGAEATHLLAADSYGRGRYLTAAELWDRLQARHPQASSLEPSLSLQLAAAWRMAGKTEESEAALRKGFKHGVIDRGTVEVVIAGERRAAPRGEALAPWLEKSLGLPAGRPGETNWPLFQKDAAQSGLAPSGAAFVQPIYSISLAEDGRLVEAIDELNAAQRKNKGAILPAGAPLVVGETLLVRTAADVRAIDLTSGETRWRAENDDALRHLLRASAEPWTAHNEFVLGGLASRLYEEVERGLLSSDGRFVFGVEASPFGVEGAYQRRTVDETGKSRLAIDEGHDHNRLAAYDIATGKLLWEVGGPPPASEETPPEEGEDPFAENEATPAPFEAELPDDLAGVFFMSAPLPLADRLYVVGRNKQTSHLLALAPASGRLLGSTPLYQHPPSAFDINDQLAIAAGRWGQAGATSAAPCAAAGGVIVCPLGAGKFAAVDVSTNGSSTNRFLWLFHRPREDDPALNQALALARRRGLEVESESANEGWKQASATIAGDRVVLAPEGEDEVYCLSLGDGRVQWSAPRGDGLYVGGATSEAVAIVGEGRLSVLLLATGKPIPLAENVARAGEYPAGAAPAGRGYITGDRYHLPLLGDAEGNAIAAFDLASGELVARSRARNTLTRGVSQGESEGQLGNLIRVRDFVISQNAGTVARFETLASRRQQLVESVAGDAKLETQIDLADALLSNGDLDQALAAWRAAGSHNPASLAILAEIVAEGLRRDFQSYLPVAKEFADAFVSAAGQGSLRETILRELAAGYERRQKHALAAEQYLSLAGAQSLAGESQLEPRAPRLEVVRERWVLARLSDLYTRAGAEGRQQIEALAASKFPGGWRAALALETGPFRSPVAQIAAAKELAPSKPLEAHLLLLAAYTSSDEAQRSEALALLAGGEAANQATPWLRGKVEVDAAFPTENSSPRLPLAIRPAGASDARLAPLWLEIDIAHRKLVAKDRQGVELWSVALPLPEGGSMGRPDDMQALRLGQLVFVADGLSVYGVDARTKSQLAENANRLLWQRSSPASASAIEQQYRAQLRAMRQAGGASAARRERLAAAGGAIFFQLGDELIAARPASGETLWRRTNVPSQCDLLAEGEVLLASPDKDGETLAFAVLDGRELAREGGALAAPLQGRLGVRGRKLLLWESGDREAAIRLYDPWTGEDAWRRSFDPQSRASLVEGENEAAVLAPSGRLEIVECQAGQTRLLTGVEPNDDCEAIRVQRDPEQYILAIQRRAKDPQQAAAMMGGFLGAGAAPVNGFVAGIDPASGKRRWSVKAVDQFLYIGRAAELPVLAMMARKIAEADGEATWPTHLVVVDRRDGRVLLDETGEERTNLYEIAANSEEQTVELRMNGPGVKLKFTDAPVKKRAR